MSYIHFLVVFHRSSYVSCCLFIPSQKFIMPLFHLKVNAAHLTLVVFSELSPIHLQSSFTYHTCHLLFIVFELILLGLMSVPDCSRLSIVRGPSELRHGLGSSWRTQLGSFLICNSDVCLWETLISTFACASEKESLWAWGFLWLHCSYFLL